MNRSTPGLPVHHYLLEFTQTHTQTQSIESMMLSSHLIISCPLLLLPPIPPSIRVFSNESTLLMRWAKYWSFTLFKNKKYSLLSLSKSGLTPHRKFPTHCLFKYVVLLWVWGSWANIQCSTEHVFVKQDNNYCSFSFLSSQTCNHSEKWVSLLSFYNWRNWGSEKLRILPKVKQFINNVYRIKLSLCFQRTFIYASFTWSLSAKLTEAFYFWLFLAFGFA